jgi:hypothetical protein
LKYSLLAFFSFEKKSKLVLNFVSSFFFNISSHIFRVRKLLKYHTQNTELKNYLTYNIISE